MSLIDTELIPSINQSLETVLPAALSMDELRKQLAKHISYLINHDFEKLVFLVYRIDVSEVKLKQLLQENKEADAAGLIADLIIERQLQKIKSRREFNRRDNDIDETEKW
ncbi:MAG: hypothetical protein FJY20_05920 [Bacteroidetes bacterium]|nr:hypothetical protein [Bacteroidota bacterium]